MTRITFLQIRIAEKAELNIEEDVDQNELLMLYEPRQRKQGTFIIDIYASQSGNSEKTVYKEMWIPTTSMALITAP